jgi:hypothetical protein
MNYTWCTSRVSDEGRPEVSLHSQWFFRGQTIHVICFCGLMFFLNIKNDLFCLNYHGFKSLSKTCETKD